jgi:hypothetical protein
MSTPTMTDLGNVLTAGTPQEERPVVRFATDGSSPVVYVATGKRGRPSRFGFLLEYVSSPAKTPTGGRFIARRCKVRRLDGSIWVGQFRNGAETVKLRPLKGKEGKA